MKYVLVTGGAGYVGSHTCKELYKNGFTPIVYDNFYRGNKWAVKWGPVVVGDILDREMLINTIEKYDPIAVIHFAALAYVPESVERPFDYYQTNVTGSINLLNVCKDLNLKKFIFSSSCSTYGISGKELISEETLQKPLSPYGKSKYITEQILNDWVKIYNFKAVSLRYFNASGADLDGEIGEFHVPETHLIPNILLVSLGKKKTMPVYGKHFDTHDGTAIRDYIHVKDLALAHVNSLKHVLNNDESFSCNLGSGIGTSVLELIKISENITKTEIPFKIFPARIGDAPSLIANTLKAQKKLNFKTNYSDPNVIVSSAWKWMENSKNLFSKC